MIKETLINFISVINKTNEAMFFCTDKLVDKLNLAEWAADAIKDSIHMLPFLFFIFVFIELIEFFYSEKINNLTKYAGKAGPLIGSLAATFPQCGFSVIASTLYIKRLISKGTLIAVYIATSDEAIPVIMAEPSKIHLLLPILAAKIIIAVIAGYLVDFIFDKCKKRKKSQNYAPIENTTEDIQENTEHGCCKHNVEHPRKRDLIFHPLEHTFNIFVFILIITLGLNFVIQKAGGEEALGYYLLRDSVLQPIIMSIAGLIPNCAVSLAITLMYLKGAIGFGSVIAGLSSGAGLGLLVLIRKNECIKDTLKIILILLFISMFSGILLQAVFN